ncbi:MAG: arylamine N-acetyltransferase [Actinomycetota bacterium]|nr:arylamine N-acetyltransferase [Actinomycetota bacterium]
MSAPTLRAPETDEWDVASLDLDAYLDRIGHSRVPPSADALRSLHEAHVRAVPFENVDVVLGTHRGLGLDVIGDKLVGRHRGGYCYEHALLFAAVLERLGYPVQRRIARVQPHRAGPRTHMMLTVPADGVDYLVEVGFGAGMLYPMPLRDEAEVDQAGWQHRLTRDGAMWTLSKCTGNSWQPLHAFDDTPQRAIDYGVEHHYTSTHPRSSFTGRLIIMRLDHGVSRRLVGDELTVEYADGRLERTSVAPEQLDATLRELDVVLDLDQLDALAARRRCTAR